MVTLSAVKAELLGLRGLEMECGPRSAIIRDCRWSSRRREGLIGGLVVLGLHVTGFAACPAIILAVLAKADIKLSAAKPAIFGAGAAAFYLVAQAANVILGHTRRVPRFAWDRQYAKRTCPSGAGVHALRHCPTALEFEALKWHFAVPGL